MEDSKKKSSEPRGCIIKTETSLRLLNWYMDGDVRCCGCFSCCDLIPLKRWDCTLRMLPRLRWWWCCCCDDFVHCELLCLWFVKHYRCTGCNTIHRDLLKWKITPSVFVRNVIMRIIIIYFHVIGSLENKHLSLNEECMWGNWTEKALQCKI